MSPSKYLREHHPNVIEVAHVIPTQNEAIIITIIATKFLFKCNVFIFFTPKKTNIHKRKGVKMGMPIRNSLALMGKKKTNQPKKLISLKLIGSYVPRNAD